MESTTDHHDPSEGTGMGGMDDREEQEREEDEQANAMDSEGLVIYDDIDPTPAQMCELLRERLIAAITDALEVCPMIRLQQQTNVMFLEAIRDGLENHGIELTFIPPTKENTRGQTQRPESRIPSRDGR